MHANQKKNIIHLSVYTAILMFTIIYLILYKNSFSIPCFYYKFFHIKCPSCGATRAFISLIHLDISAAISYNGLFAAGIYPISVLIILQDISITVYNLIKNSQHISFLQYLCGKKENRNK